MVETWMGHRNFYLASHYEPLERVTVQLLERVNVELLDC